MADVPPPLKAMEAAAQQDLLAAVDRAQALRVRVQGRDHPAPGSPADMDVAVTANARWVIVGAGMAVRVAVDHLIGWRALARGGLLPVYSPMTILRGALEGAVTARWLLDPRLPPLERLARAFAAQDEDYRERGLFEQAARDNMAAADLPPPPEPDPPGKSAPARRADLYADREAAGIPNIPMARVTDLVAEYGPDYSNLTWLYRLASAFAHGKPWASHATSMGPRVPHEWDRIHQGTMEASEVVLTGSTAKVTDTVEAAIADWERYLGIRPTEEAAPLDKSEMSAVDENV